MLEANASSKGAERFPRPLHSLSHSSFPPLVSSGTIIIKLAFDGFGLVLGFASGGLPRHDVVVSETLSVLPFPSYSQRSSQQHRYVLKETRILRNAHPCGTAQCRTFSITTSHTRLTFVYLSPLSSFVLVSGSPFRRFLLKIY